MELTFFIASYKVLVSGFVAKIVLRTYQHLAVVEQCLHSFKAFSFSHSASLSPVNRVGVSKNVRGDTARTADLN